MKRKSLLKYILILLIPVTFSSCNDVLDKEYLEAINPEDIWNDANLAEAYVNNFYGSVMPGWPLGSAADSDEGTVVNQISSWLNGTATIDSYNYWPYDKIRTINTFMENIDTGGIDENDRNKLKGQMLFWRAWLYFGMTKGYGGVPIITEPQAVDDPDIKVKRSNAEACFTQIIKDLDDAIAFLPDEPWSGADVGRIDRMAAKAFKGRVLLFWASPLFNPVNDKARWQSAYDANKEAVEYAKSKGKGLYQDFENIWYEELNKESLMFRRYHNPGSTFFVGGIRPIIYSKDRANDDNVSLDLVNAFPMIDGSEFDPSAGYNTLSIDRDPRFYATVAYNGSNMNLADMVEQNTYLWTYYSDKGSTEGSHPSPSSFYRQKGQDLVVKQSEVYDATVDWIEIRFAEALMNMGEAANEIDKDDEALDVLYQIRKRAGIQAGADNKYGIMVSDKDAIRTAYYKERFIEFALEGKRWDDIRRLKKFADLNALVKRKGLRWDLKAGAEVVDGKDDITDPDIYNRFTVTVVNTGTEEMNVKDEYYFYAIPRTHLERNSNLEQTKGWDNGTFDPLK